LTQPRAYKFAGPICRPGSQEVIWKPSLLECRKQQRPEPVAVAGRLIAIQIGRGKSKQWLYLFTTAALPMEEVVALYGQRWNIEADLRSLKRTVQLHHIRRVVRLASGENGRRQSDQRRLAQSLREGLFRDGAADAAVAVFERMNRNKVQVRDSRSSEGRQRR